MSLAVLARKSKTTNPRYNNSRGCFRLNMTNRGKLRTCINDYNKDCGSCNVNNRKVKGKTNYATSKQSSYHNFQRKIKMNIKKKEWEQDKVTFQKNKKNLLKTSLWTLQPLQQGRSWILRLVR